MNDERLAAAQKLLADLKDATRDLLGRVNDAAYDAGFAAGIEAAILALAERRQEMLDDRGGCGSAASDEAGYCIEEIRNLKPEASNG